MASKSNEPSGLIEHKQIRQIRRVIRILTLLARQQPSKQQTATEETIRRLEISILHIKSGSYKITED